MAGADSDAKSIVKVGPGGWWGYHAWDAKGISKITRILISLEEDHISNYIRSLQFQYIEDGKTKLSSVYGNNSYTHPGFNFQTVVLNEEKEEYITRLSGSALYNDKRVTCLTFETNLKKYGPFGSVPAGAKNFSFSLGPGNNFAGFFGSCSQFHTRISSIGCYFSPNLN